MRQSVVKRQASEKIVLARVAGVRPLTNWANIDSNLYENTVKYYLAELRLNGTLLTKVDGTPAAGQYSYNPTTNVVTLFSATAPAQNKIVAKYWTFFSNAPVTVSADLTDGGPQVPWDARITASPGYSFKIGVEQDLVAKIGSGTLTLQNADGKLDALYNSVYFENQEVDVFSWFRGLPYSDAKPIYRGIVESKSYNVDQISLTLKDRLFRILNSLPVTLFTQADNVERAAIEKPQRIIIGKVEGLQTQSVDVIGASIPLSGTISLVLNTPDLTGAGTAFLSELTPGDKIFVQGVEYEIQDITSDTAALLTRVSQQTVDNVSVTYRPSVPIQTKNREHLIASHPLSEIVKTVVQVTGPRSIEFDNVGKLFIGDSLFVDNLNGVRTIRQIFGNNVIFDEFLFAPVAPGSFARRIPVPTVSFKDRFIPSNLYTVNNGPVNSKIVLDQDAEFQVAPVELFKTDCTWTNGSRTVTTAGDFTEFLKPRDWIKLVTESTWHEILSVTETTIVLRTPYSGTNATAQTNMKRLDVVDDFTPLVITAYGANNSAGQWISTAAEASAHLLELGGFQPIAANFQDGLEHVRQTVSIVLPERRLGAIPTLKNALDLLSSATLTAVGLDNNLEPKLVSFRPAIRNVMRRIADEDVIDYKIRSVSGQIASEAVFNYAKGDKEVPPRGVVTSFFVLNVLGINNKEELELGLINFKDAETLARRRLFSKQTERSDYEITSDLRLEEVEVGERVILDLRRAPDTSWAATRQKIAIVVGKQVTGETVKLFLTDFGNLFNRTARFTESAASNFSGSESIKKLENGFFVEKDGTVDTIDESSESNLFY